MSWLIEREKDGTPLRMWWVKESERERELQANLERAERNNALPMESMREWARKRGLI